jgi:diguanylate cyclase (GGDEF)-like protein
VITLARLLFPLLLLAVPWALAPLARSLEPALVALLDNLPLFLGLLAVFFAGAFKRGRLTLVAAHLVAAVMLIQAAQTDNLNAPDSYVVFILTSLIAPLMQAWVVIQQDTSLLSRRGIFKLASALLPYLIIGAAWHYHPGELVKLLVQFPPLLLDMVHGELLLNKLAAWVCLGLILLGLVLTLFRRTGDEVALLGSLLSFALGVAYLRDPALSTLFFILIPTLVLVAVTQHIYAMAFIDGLTGVPARRALEHRLAGLGRHYAIAMLDIDHFKKFNDTYGHDVGDQVLRMVATQLRRVEAGGTLYRYGGEEFTIVFSGRREEEVVNALDRVRERVANYPMQVRAPQRPRNDKVGRESRGGQTGQTQVTVNISIGVAWREPEEKPAQVIKRADKALYRAKGAGRNRVMTDGPDPRRQRGRAA